MKCDSMDDGLTKCYILHILTYDGCYAMKRQMAYVDKHV